MFKKYPQRLYAIVACLIFLGGLTPFLHVAVQSAACPSLVPGDLFKIPGVSTVYILNNESKSLYYPNSPVFHSWHDPQNTIIHEIDPGCADAYPPPTRPPYGVNFRPGTLMKSPSSARVYAVGRGGVIYPIPSEDVARSIYGANWASRVRDISQVFWQNYQISKTFVTANQPPEGTLTSIGGAVYEFTNGTWLSIAGEVPVFVQSTIVPIPSSLFTLFPVASESISSERLGDNVATTGEENLTSLPEWQTVYNSIDSADAAGGVRSPQPAPSPAPVTPPPAPVNSGGGGGGGGSSGGGSSPPPPPPPAPTTAPDLSLSSAAATTTVTLGNTIVLTYTYQNSGDAAATGVAIGATVPTGTTFSTSGSGSWSCSNGSSAGTACSHSVGSVAVGATGTVAFALNTLSSGVGSITTTATISANETDSSSTNNTTSTAVTIVAPNLAITASSTFSRIMPGGTAIFTYFYSNTGNIAATGTAITVVVPTSTTFRSASSTGSWSCANGAVAGTSCVATIGALASGASSSVNFAVLTQSALIGNVTTTAMIADAETNGTDSNTSNNTATRTVRVAFLSESDSYIAALVTDLDQYSSTSSSTYANLGAYKMMPGTGTTFIVLNGVLGFPSGATDPTVSHPTPIPTSTSVPLRYAHTQLVSGDGAAEPAGIFGEVDGRLFTGVNGFYVRSRVSRATNNFGGRGTILSMGTNFGAPGYEPTFLENGFGYGFNSTFATSTGYHFFLRNGTYDTGDPTANLTDVALGSAAPRDDRMYEASFVVEAGSTTGTARLLDLSDPDNPVTVDERTFRLPTTTVAYFPEINASPGPLASGQTPQTFRIYFIEGTQYLPNSN